MKRPTRKTTPTSASKRNSKKSTPTSTSTPALPPAAIFTRDDGKKVPASVRDAADLWLDMFMGILTSGIDSTTPLQYHQRWLDDCALLADQGLSLFESRWPHESHKTQ